MASTMIDRSHGRDALAVVVKNLWMTFRGSRPDQSIAVLERVSVDVRQGEFICFVGPSGCGKTTLLNIIAGFQLATQGEVLVEGKPVRGPSPRRVFIFQEGGV